MSCVNQPAGLLCDSLSLQCAVGLYLEAVSLLVEVRPSVFSFCQVVFLRIFDNGSHKGIAG